MYEINVLSKAYLQNPFAFLEPGLKEKIVVVNPFGIKGLTRHNDLKFVYEKPDVFRSDAMDLFITKLRGTGFNPLGQPLVSLDGKRHLLLKKSLGRAMKQAKTYKDSEMYDLFLKNWMLSNEDKSLDSINSFFSPFVYFISSEYLGLELDDFAGFVNIALSLSANTMNLSADQKAKIIEKHIAFKSICEASLKVAKEGTIAGGLYKEFKEGRISKEEALDLFRFTFYASSETTRKFLPTIFYYIDQNNIDYQDIIDNSKLYFDEFLRLFSPAQFSIRRVAEDIETPTGILLKKGETIFLFNHFANRDSGVFENPNEFDLNRSNISQHLGLGKGAHYCLGGGIVETEIKELLKFLIHNSYRMSFTSPPQYKDELFLRGPCQLDFRISKA